MIGTRMPDESAPHTWPPGAYGRYHARWMIVTPNGWLGDVTQHQVTEHEDRTITVAPSILVTTGRHGAQWHGFLEHGVWRSV